MENIKVKINVEGKTNDTFRGGFHVWRRGMVSVKMPIDSKHKPLADRLRKKAEGFFMSDDMSTYRLTIRPQTALDHGLVTIPQLKAHGARLFKDVKVGREYRQNGVPVEVKGEREDAPYWSFLPNNNPYTWVKNGTRYTTLDGEWYTEEVSEEASNA